MADTVYNVDFNLGSFMGAVSGVSGGDTEVRGDSVKVGEEKQIRRMNLTMGGIMKKVFLPFVAGAGLAGMIMQVVANSKAIQTFTKAGADILDAMLSIILIPLFPVWIQILKIFQQLMPIFSVLSRAIFEPIVRYLSPLLEIIGKVFSLLGSFIKWMEAKEPKVKVSAEEVKGIQKQAREEVDILTGTKEAPWWRRFIAAWGVESHNTLQQLAEGLGEETKKYEANKAKRSEDESRARKEIDDILKWVPQGYQSGTQFVPRNMLAYLHQGEAVIPAKYNTGNTQNNSANIQNYFNITSNNVDPTFLGEEMQRKIIQGLNFRLRQ